MDSNDKQRLDAAIEALCQRQRAQRKEMDLLQSAERDALLKRHALEIRKTEIRFEKLGGDKVFAFGVWYPMEDAPKKELPEWVIVTDGVHRMPAFWDSHGERWELALSPNDIGCGEMGELVCFMIPPLPSRG